MVLSTLQYACIAPHGADLIPELAARSTEGRFLETREGMRRLAREIASSKPDAIIIASPHNLRLVGRIAVVVAEHSSGTLHTSSEKSVSLTVNCDRELAQDLLKRGNDAGLPVVGANYGTSEGKASDMPMDWGTLVPLWFVFRHRKLRAKVVIVAPAREIPLRQNYEFGSLIAGLGEKKRKRVVFIASADQAHAHSKSGPYGFNIAAARYDQLVCTAISENRLSSILNFDKALVDNAMPDSLWQMSILAGIGDKVNLSPKLLSYQVPTYYGMICASFRQVH